MKILFVYPNKEGFGIKPIGISLLAAILKKEGHEVDLFDTTFYDLGYIDTNELLKKQGFFKHTNIDDYNVAKKKIDLKEELYKKLKLFNPEILAVSALSDEVEIAEKISEYVNEYEKEVIIIWGNKAVTMGYLPINYDYIIKGEGIESLKNLLISNNYIGTVTEVDKYFQDLDSLPYLDWSIFDSRQFLKQYDGKVLRGGDCMITWGCPNSCTYCINEGYRKLYGPNAGKYIRQYSVNRAISELEYLKNTYKLEFLKFHDEDFCLKDIEYLQELAVKYVEYVGVPFTIMANARNLTEDKIKILKYMGCVSVSMGFEAGNDIIRKILNRKETKEQIIESTKMLNSYGIRTSSFNMIGLPFETEETILETIKLNADSEVQCPNVSFFFPLEGTLLRKISIDYGFYKPDKNVKFITNEPVLSFPGISKDKLNYYFENFNNLIKEFRKGGSLW